MKKKMPFQQMWPWISRKRGKGTEAKQLNINPVLFSNSAALEIQG